MTAPGPHRFQFGRFELDARAAELTCEGRQVPLPRQSVRLLEALARRPGSVVTRDEARALLWPDGTHVDYEHGLNNAVARLRRGLHEAAGAAHFVETLPRIGYRLVVPVVPVGGHAQAVPWPSMRAWQTSSRRVDGRVAALLAGLLLAGFSAGRYLQPASSSISPVASLRAARHAERSLVYSRLVLDGALAAELALDAAEAEAWRALALDSRVAEAHAALGLTALWGRWDWSGAGTSLEAAVALDPASARARHARALWMLARGRLAEAASEIDYAYRLDPDAPDIARDAALLAFRAGDLAAARARLDDLLARQPDDARGHELMSDLLSSLGQHSAAARHFQQFLRLAGVDAARARDAAAVVAAQGMVGLIRRNLSQPSNKPLDRYGVAFKLATSHAVVGNVDDALRWLEVAYAQRDSRLLFLRADARFTVLSGDPRFQAMLARIYR